MPESSVNIIIENLLILQPLLYKNLLKPARFKSPLTPGAIFIMGMLKRHGKMSMSEIGRMLHMPKPHVTLSVDKLIAEDLVERINDPNDRRIVNVQITEKGIVDLHEIKKEISENLRNKLLTLDTNAIETLMVASQQIRDILTLLHNQDDCCCTKENNE